MFYYKFKVYFDEIEDFVRDVEIAATDTFESFYKILYDCIGLKGNEFASFSICDPKWNKLKEITLMDMSDEEDLEEVEPEYGEEDNYTTRSNLPKFVMADCVLKDFINDPHQHIMLEYDFMNPKVFYIELQKALKTEEPAEVFPRCTFKKMELPVAKAIPRLPDDEEMLEGLDLDEEEDSDDPFESDYSEEDLENLDEFNFS